MKKLFLTALFCVFSTFALASQVINFSWELPTKRVNGDALAASEIKFIELSYSFNGGETKLHTLGPGTKLYKVEAALPAGKHSVEAWARVQDKGGFWSDYANVIYDFDVPVSKPGVLENFSIEITCTEGNCTGKIRVE